MAIANLIPYIVTRGTYATDGHEIAGFPLRCYDIGGICGVMYFSLTAMAANIMLAVLVATLFSIVVQDGNLTTLRRWQTWGTPEAR